MLLTVEAAAYFDGNTIGKGSLDFLEDNLSWTGATTDGVTKAVTVKFSQISDYGSLSCKHDTHPSSRLYLLHNSNADGNHVYIRFDLETPGFLEMVMELLMERVDVDPRHVVSVGPLECTSDDADIVMKGRSGCGPSRIATSILKAQITCIRFVDNFMLAGIGDCLHIFQKGGSKYCWTLLGTRQIFQGQTIHGIRVNCNNGLIIYGGKHVSFLRLLINNTCKIRLMYSFTATDWVLDCAWLQGDCQVALLTANNAIVLYDLKINHPILASERHCRERCIIYSGIILGDFWNEMVVLAGTVFSTIILWSNEGDDERKNVIHHLQGHKGVIFSVSYCEVNQRISSTSDDRTVRVWDVEFETLNNWRTSKITLKYTLYGHSARVWKSSLLRTGQIVSVGEDSRICLWNVHGMLENQFSGHQDGEIWSLAVSETSQLIATGGSDGGISLWPIKKAYLPHELKNGEQKGLKPKCVGLGDEGVPFMVTWSGELYLFCNSEWKLYLSEPEFNSYCLHAVSFNRKLLLLAGITGRLIICQFSHDSLSKILDTKVCEGRIFSLVWLSNSSFVISESGGLFSIWELSLDEKKLRKKTDFILPYSKERWVTSCAADDSHVVTGDRCGSLHLYLKDGPSTSPVYTAKKIHTHNGVTDVKFLNGKFISTGRDGKCCELIIENNTLVMLKCCKLKIDWIAAVSETKLLDRVLFCFHEVFFIVWSIKSRRPVLKLDCGGGHRSWDCSVDEVKKRISIIYIKGKSVYYCLIPFEDILCHTLLPGSHPKAINSAKLVSAPGNDNPLILLGGEDTTLRLVSLTEGDLVELCVLQGHLSSIRAIASYQSAFSDTVFIASGGGRGQLVFWKVHQSLAQASLDVVELNSYSVTSQEKTAVTNDVAEMRIMDLQVYQRSRESVTIVAGCSDGILRIFTYSVDSNSISESQVINCHNCVLKVCVFNFLEDTFLIATSTGGKLFFYSIASFGKLSKNDDGQTFSLSNTGINSCDCESMGSCLILACAGDDGLVNFVLFNKDPGSEHFEKLDVWINDAAHACQISGLKMVQNLVFTTGLDQKLAIFSWATSGNRISADLIARVELCIPDIHGILVWPSDCGKSYNVFVYGLGSQLLQVVA